MYDLPHSLLSYTMSSHHLYRLSAKLVVRLLTCLIGLSAHQLEPSLHSVSPMVSSCACKVFYVALPCCLFEVAQLVERSV